MTGQTATVAPPEPPSERMRASRLRAQLRNGKPLPEDKLSWLRDYDAARATHNRRRQRTTSTGMHVTQPQNENLDPSSFVWEPKMPAEAQPPAGDVATGDKPATGTPLVAVAAPPAPTGDPVAAQQFRALVQFIAQAGIAAGREILATSEYPLPPIAISYLSSDEELGKAIVFIGDAAERVAIKYNFRQVPLMDEAIVGGAVAGSALLVVHNFKRKKQTPAQQAAPPAPKEAQPTAQPTAPPASAATAVNSIWSN
jgi:hypothetical protein